MWQETVEVSEFRGRDKKKTTTKFTQDNHLFGPGSRRGYHRYKSNGIRTGKCDLVREITQNHKCVSYVLLSANAINKDV